MPQTKSAKKRLRQSVKKTNRNRQIKNKAKKAKKNFLQLINQGNLEEARTKLPELMSIIDTTAEKGVWHKNKAAREKSRLMRKLNQSKS